MIKLQKCFPENNRKKLEQVYTKKRQKNLKQVHIKQAESEDIYAGRKSGGCHRRIRGIGKAIALKLASQGAKVVINYNGSEEKAKEVQAQIETEGGKAVIYRCDVSDYGACQTFIQDVIKTEGSMDILVNNAGITRDGLLMKMSEEDFDKVIDTNLKGAFHTIRFAARQMLKQRSGRIINMASVVGVTGNAGQANYAASKAGVIGLTKATARELASRGITVNAVAPGY